MDVLIVGFGVVGNNLSKEIEKLNPEIYDKYKNKDTRTKEEYDIAFICVDTPISDDCLCDLTEVKKAIEENTAEIYVIKSTILGGEKEDCQKIIQVLQQVYDGRHTFRVVNSTTAELAKYMENSWLATKVSFCTQFYQIAKKNDVNYEELRELFILDPRVNPSHTFVYDEHPYWSSHCLDKDVNAIAKSENAELLLDIIEFNNKCKDNERD